jgi:hypothetical protein
LNNGSVLAQKFVAYFDRHSGQAGDSWRDPESRNFEGFWMPVFTGMTARDEKLFTRTLIPGH